MDYLTMEFRAGHLPTYDASALKSTRCACVRGLGGDVDCRSGFSCSPLGVAGAAWACDSTDVAKVRRFVTGGWTEGLAKGLVRVEPRAVSKLVHVAAACSGTERSSGASDRGARPRRKARRSAIGVGVVLKLTQGESFRRRPRRFDALRSTKMVPQVRSVASQTRSVTNH